MSKVRIILVAIFCGFLPTYLMAAQCPTLTIQKSETGEGTCPIIKGGIPSGFSSSRCSYDDDKITAGDSLRPSVIGYTYAKDPYITCSYLYPPTIIDLKTTTSIKNGWWPEQGNEGNIVTCTPSGQQNCSWTTE